MGEWMGARATRRVPSKFRLIAHLSVFWLARSQLQRLVYMARVEGGEGQSGEEEEDREGCRERREGSTGHRTRDSKTWPPHAGKARKAMLVG